MNKKGFTLIELLAVIVILAVLALVASTNVFNILENARRGSFRTEFLSMLEAAQTTASIDLMNGEFDHVTKTSICYVLSSDEKSENVLNKNYDNKNKYSGSVLVEYKDSGTFILTGWLKGDYFQIVGKGDHFNNDTDNIPKAVSSTNVQNCGGAQVGKTSGTA